MEQLVILSKLEQEYLLHAIEAAIPLRDARQFRLWTQGPLQALLPHQVMVCLQFGEHDELRHIECAHSMVLDAGVHNRLANRDDGLALRLARHCGGEAEPALAPFLGELRELGMENLLIRGTERLPGGATFFVLFGLPHRPRPRHAYFLELLLPYLHMGLQRVGGSQARTRAAALARPVSAREAEILHWVREGKSNEEIGLILGISGLTVKNHLQRLYRLLGVSNRAHAIARGMALQLFDRPTQMLARAA
ncbi:LuxR C-terminal-related transcriptional regulator [Duganella aceris]|uniref:Helix-turn-helix transcriptional regulator n=1 Tax=Duganella aceris TaxID=2703883 RepID=A0ABX0FTJ1_9BURK|nr:LuxR C-terminal-related transcriptional regulator [Duganella aceris]NGZ88014.1 helix-turn-helix transcriptional regulator [Duganella aceris]